LQDLVLQFNSGLVAVVEEPDSHAINSASLCAKGDLCFKIGLQLLFRKFGSQFVKVSPIVGVEAFQLVKPFP
jgi:hypothetical protein